MWPHTRTWQLESRLDFSLHLPLSQVALCSEKHVMCTVVLSNPSLPISGWQPFDYSTPVRLSTSSPPPPTLDEEDLASLAQILGYWFLYPCAFDYTQPCCPSTGQLQAQPVPSERPLHHWLLSRVGKQTPNCERPGWVWGVGMLGISPWSPTYPWVPPAQLSGIWGPLEHGLLSGGQYAEKSGAKL